MDSTSNKEINGCVFLVSAILFTLIAFAIAIPFGVLTLLIFIFTYCAFSRKNNEKIIAESHFQDLLKQIQEFDNFANKLRNDINFYKYTNNLSNVQISLSGGSFGELDPNSFIGKIKILMLVDLTRSLLKSGHKLDLNTKEGFGLLLILCNFYGMTFSYDAINYCNDNLKLGEDMLRQLLKLPEPKELFILTHLMGDFDEDYKFQYNLLIYRYTSLMAKCDGIVTKQESDWLDEIIELGRDNTRSLPLLEHVSEGETTNAIEELNALIGLDNVKNEISKLTNLIKIQQQRKINGMKVTIPSYHCVFTGNPGTGKTTVARIVSEIYKELGILKKGHLVETDRSGLVAEYVGQTAVKTNQIIDKALDGILFIDEAYSLITQTKNDFGREAIATLLKRMEDNRDRLVVILAGYSKEMQDFINSNPRLRSRFNRYIDFADYTAKELLEIFKQRANKFEYTLTQETEECIFNLFKNAVAKKEQGFGNGRFARNIFDKTIEIQSTRLSQQSNLTIDKLAKILPEDIPTL